MPIYEITSNEIRPFAKTTFGLVNVRERRDLQRLLRANVSVVAPDTLVIAQEFGDWDESRRGIDLLGIDRDANLVVVELTLPEDGCHMELQAIRYAAMVSTMTFDQAVDLFGRYLTQIGKDETDARAELLDFLGWDEPDEDAFAQDVRIVLASAEFSRELATSVLWLIERGVNIRCVRLQPYSLDGRLLVDVQQIIPLPEVAEYQVRVTKKKQKKREARTGTRDLDVQKIIPLPEVAEYQVRVAEKNRKERGARTVTLDWTRYDGSLGGRQLLALRKRHAIYQVFRYLVESGIAPEKVAAQCGRRARRAIVFVDGEVGRDDFCRLAEEARAKQGRNFDPRRYFCGDDELVHFEGRTYAFLNQWGGRAFDEAMVNLRAAFSDKAIAFAPSE
jgi:hypothetical protein